MCWISLAQRDFLFWAQQALNIDTGTVDDLPRIRAILEKYVDLLANFADASLVALCERIKRWDIVSVDSDFTIYRGRDKRCFNNTLRKRLERLVRKPLGFSKYPRMYELVLQLFLHRYNLDYQTF